MTAQLTPVPMTPGAGVPVAAFKDPATGDYYQAVVEVNPDLTLGAPSTPSANSFTSTTSLQQMTNVPFMKGVTIEALSTNLGSIWIGTTSTGGATPAVGGPGYELLPGASVSLPISNLNLLWVIGAGQLNYIGV